MQFFEAKFKVLIVKKCIYLAQFQEKKLFSLFFGSKPLYYKYLGKN